MSPEEYRRAVSAYWTHGQSELTPSESVLTAVVTTRRVGLLDSVTLAERRCRLAVEALQTWLDSGGVDNTGHGR
jgi:hypothetical protein